MRRIRIATLATMTAILMSQARANEFDLSWHSIDCGGGTSSALHFSISGTIAQHDAAVMTGGIFTVVGGFWAAPQIQCTEFVPADCNCDGQITNADVSAFALALVDGLAYQLAYPLCNADCVADLNHDGNTDGLDVSTFVTCLTDGCP